MKPHLFILLFFLLLLCLPALAQEQQVVVPYTLADRNRAILTDAKISALEDKMEVRFESIDKQFMPKKIAATLFQCFANTRKNTLTWPKY